ncbi:MAG: hypothetical protein Q7S48_05235 [bacterium]|nr:hypothetical protein [bacterium]
MCIHPKTYKKLALQVGALFSGLSVLCFFWPMIRGLSPELMTFHYQMWQIAFFGYTGANVASFISAVVQSFIWGVIVVGVWKLAGICCKGGGHGQVSVADGKEGGDCCKK